MKHAKAFLIFWYDFIVGDDWRVAAGIAGALGVTYAVSQSTTRDWWIVPVAVAVVLPTSLWRAARAARRQ